MHWFIELPVATQVALIVTAGAIVIALIWRAE